MKKWKIIGKRVKGKGERVEDIIKILLKNRGLKTKKETEEFLNPPNPSTLNPIPLGIKKGELTKAVKRVQEAINNQEQIIVFGDYDVDGICGCAILWETLHGLGANAMPYIPHRIEEGYGLSIKGIKNILTTKVKPSSRFNLNKTRLVITVDNGIVANEAVALANKNGIDVVITDHHVPGRKLPEAYSIIHTTKLCGAGVAWALVQQLTTNNKQLTTHLELVALATIADLVPLLGANRTLTKYGLEELRETKRVGLLELFKEAALESQTIDTYKVGHIIAPRLNAMGRIEHAMDSLRLLCTRDRTRARNLAQKLATTNRERQQMTEEITLHAKKFVRGQKLEVDKLLFIAHESYQQGVIGLVAGKLVEEFYRPAIVVAKGKEFSKASARSINGFNIIEFIRSAQELLIDAGGHPMAAGFTVRTEKLVLLQKKLEELAEKEVRQDLLERTVRVDCEIELREATDELYREIQKFAPFGMGNPQPTFLTRNVIIDDMFLVGNDGRHLKLKLSTLNSQLSIEAIAFGMGERAQEFHIGDTVDIVYTIEEDSWNNSKQLQLKIKDVKVC